MNYTEILAPAAVFTVLVLSAAPAHAQAHGYRGRSSVGVHRGPVRAMVGPRAVVGLRSAIPRPIVGGSPFYSPHYVLRAPVRVGYGLAVGYPVAFAGAYPYPYVSPYPSPTPLLAFGPGRGYRIPRRSSLAIIGMVGGSVTRGVARLALRLLIP